MSNEINKFNWIFGQMVSPDQKLIDELFINGEEWVIAYKTIRDIAIFTNKRIIIRDKQGLTGKKIETYTIPYNIIHMYSIENAGTLDITCELQLWTRAGNMKLKFKYDFDMNVINKLLSDVVLSY